MLHFLQNFDDGRDAVIHFNADAFYAQEAYFDVAWNIFVLLAIIDFDNSFIKRFEEPLYAFLKDMPEKRQHRLRFVASFILTKAVCFSRSYVRRLYLLCLANPSLHSYELLTAFSAIYREHPQSLITTTNQLELLKKYFFEKCEKCNEVHIDILLDSFSLLSKPCKQKVSDLFIQKLRSKFEPDVYYKLAILDIIAYESFVDEYLSHFHKPITGSIKSNILIHGEITMRKVNELMNLLFKNNHLLPVSNRTDLVGISPYYDWLLNMEDFDYSRFDPLWIIQYVTKYYMERIFSVLKVRTMVKEYLKHNHQPYLSNLLAIHG